MSVKPSLESIVTRFRREAGRAGGATPELEVRFQGVDYDSFAAIHAALVAKGGGVLSQTVNIIMGAPAPPGAGGPQRLLRPARIREIRFEAGRRASEQYVRKEPLVLPWRPPTAGGLTYSVALSAESPDGQGGRDFTADESAVVRVKARASFDLALRPGDELRWRADLTVTRQIAGSDVGSALKAIVAQMFATTPPMSPANLLSVLRLTDDSNPAARRLYQYEIEVELAGPPSARDAVRPADVTAAAEAVLSLTSPGHEREAALAAAVHCAASYITTAPDHARRFARELGLKQLLPAALAITRADYREIYPPRGFFLTEKADGRRALAVAHGGRAVIASDTLLDGFAAPAGADAADTVLDGELVEGPGGPVFYAFDVIAVAGKSVAAEGFEARLGHLAEAVAIVRRLGLPAEAKSYVRLTGERPAELAREIGAVHAAARPYAIDGLIFVEPGKAYSATASYKWKPAEHNTIDVLARRAPASAMSVEPFVDRPGHKLYFLFVGISPAMSATLGIQLCPGYAELFGDAARDSSATGHEYLPIQFAPADAPLAYVYHHPDGGAAIDGAIVEVRCGAGCAAAGVGGLATWEVVRVREDRRRELASRRYFGNDFRTAELIWLNYIDPFPVEQLWDGPSDGYFMRAKDHIYRAMTAAISYVKTERIAALRHAGWVIDLGAGKGQDLGRYLDAEVQHLVAVDRDRGALSELVRRRYDYARRANPRTATTLHVLATDANGPAAATLARLGALGLAPASADALVCNLAVHYFLADLPALRNLVALARGAVRAGGAVVLTVLMGEAVHAAFAAAGIPAGGTWDVFEGEPPARKYSLKRLYTGDTLEAAGQRIGVLLPFSEGRYYEEFLVNTAALTAEFAAQGFVAVSAARVAASLPGFEAHNRAVARQLTAGDRAWLDLYGELVFQRSA